MKKLTREEKLKVAEILDGKSIDYMNKGEARIAFMLEKAADGFRASAKRKLRKGGL
jgi:hypothetical protein